jgi:hypothetical protein
MGVRWLVGFSLALVMVVGLARAEVVISEFMAKNESTLMTVAGGYEDWIEIHNDTGGAVDLAGWYLTDDPGDLRKWQFPSTAATSPLPDGGYLVVFADGSEDAVIGSEVHANFKLASGGEYLALVEPDGETVVFQFAPGYPVQASDVSYGIDANTGGLAYFDSPTPGAANATAVADVVEFSEGSRAFTGSISLSLSTVSRDATIRYTLDGSIPTASSSLYSSALTIDSSTRVRARAFEAGLVAGPVVSERYLRLDAGPAVF